MRARRGGRIRDFGRSPAATTAIEYALMASLVAGVIVAALPAIGTGLKGIFEQLVAGFGS